MTIYLSKYQTFDSVEELNYHIDEYRQLTTATEFRILWLVSRYAVKYPGAAHLKAATIASELDVSTKTVYRALKSLADLGAIIKHVTTRPKSGGQGANIYTIQPCVQAQMSSRETAEKPSIASGQDVKKEKETASSINLKSVKEFNTYPDGIVSPYITFKRFVQAFIGEDQSKLINRLYGVWLAQTSYIKEVYKENDLLSVGITAIKTTMQATKRMEIRNITGYFHGTLDRMLDRLHMAAVEDDFILSE